MSLQSSPWLAPSPRTLRLYHKLLTSGSPHQFRAPTPSECPQRCRTPTLAETPTYSLVKTALAYSLGSEGLGMHCFTALSSFSEAFAEVDAAGTAYAFHARCLASPTSFMMAVFANPVFAPNFSASS